MDETDILSTLIFVMFYTCTNYLLHGYYDMYNLYIFVL